MLVRCFSEKFQQKYPTYKGCVVEEEWLNYSNFKIWWKRHKYVLDKKTQMDLDHDILGYGRKLYSAETCAVVPQQINDLVTYRHTNNTGNPIGVWYNKDVDRWWAKVSFYGKQKLVGTYRTKKEAEEGYKKYKRKFI